MLYRNTCFAILSFLFSGTLLIQACGQQTEKNEVRSAKKEKPVDLGSVAALPLQYNAPADNPVTTEKIELGRLLFFDPILSGNKDVACATCHHPEFGYAEILDLPVGVNGRGFGSDRHFQQPNDIPFSKRNAPTILNTAFNGINTSGEHSPEQAPMFWDSRVKSLEMQALQPIKQLEEMRGTAIGEQDILQVVIKRLRAVPEYRRLFKAAFQEDNAVTINNLGKAIASFERSLVANNSRFDQYMRGNAGALTQSEKEGMQLFLESGCARCHSGPMLSDYQPHVLGVADNEKRSIDSGMNNSFAFRTPTLRNLRFTAPYMHGGTMKTLEQVLTFYEDLHGKPLPNKNVSKEKLDTLAIQTRVAFKNIPRIVEFLNTLNDDSFDRTVPDAVPSGLSVGGNLK